MSQDTSIILTRLRDLLYDPTPGEELWERVLDTVRPLTRNARDRKRLQAEIFPYLDGQLGRWPEELRALRLESSDFAALSPLARTVEIDFWAKAVTRAFIKEQRARWEDPKLAHFTGLRVSHLGQNAPHVIDALFERHFQGLRFLAVQLEPHRLKDEAKMRATIHALLERAAPTLRRLHLGFTSSPSSASVSAAFGALLERADALPALRWLELDHGMISGPVNMGRQLVDSPLMERLEGLGLNGFHTEQNRAIIDALLARGAAQGLVALRMGFLDAEQLQRVTTAPELSSVRLREYHTGVPPRTWNTALGGLNTLAEGRVEQDVNQRQLFERRFVRLEGDIFDPVPLRAMLLDGDVPRQLPRVEGLCLGELTDEDFALLLELGPVVFPALRQLELNFAMTPRRVSAQLQSPWLLSLEILGWSYLVRDDDEVEAWLTLMFDASVPMFVRQRVWNGIVSRSSIKFLRALGQRAGLTGLSGLKRPELYERVRGAFPVERTRLTPMVPEHIDIDLER